MNKPRIVTHIEALLNLTLHPAPVRGEDRLSGLMPYKQNIPKYALDGDRLIGLNLANTGLTDEKWNQLTQLPDFHPEDLLALNVSDNKLNEFRLPSGMTNLQWLNVDDNPLTFPTEEITKLGNDAILRFLTELLTQGEEEMYEVKLLIVGEGQTGKTTLWNKLQDPTYPVPLPPNQQPSTVGIEIREGWILKHPEISDVQFLVNLWDFGGQEIQYMTHQFFLTRRSLYVLLADGRRETANFAYWLKIIHLLGYDPDQTHSLPVLVVLNEKGNPIAKLPYDPEHVKKHFSELEIIKREVDFAKEDDRLQGLQQAIQHILCHKMPHLPMIIPAFWNQVREGLLKLREGTEGYEKNNHISFQKFKGICQQHGIEEKDETQMRDLSQMLHDLGIILHYQEDFDLDDFIILNPQWAVNAVYSVLRNEKVKKNQGRFDLELLREVWTDGGYIIDELTNERVWADGGYTREEQRNIKNLMFKDNFEVCFRAEEHGKEIYISPQLLPPNSPPFDWEPDPHALRYVYQYPFMPKGLTGRLIVRLHEYIQTKDGQKVVWEKGMYLGHEETQALVMETKDEKTGGKIIKIEVVDLEPENRRFFLRIIRRELDKIHQSSFKSLRFEEKVPCCCGPCQASTDPHLHNLSDLKRRIDRGKTTIECNKSFEDVSVRSLLDGVYGREFVYTPSHSVKALIAEGRLKQALKELKEIVNPEKENEVILLQGRLARLEIDKAKGITDKEALNERNKISDAVLALCDQTKN